MRSNAEQRKQLQGSSRLHSGAAGQLTATLIVTSSTLGVAPVQVPLIGIGQSASGITITPLQLVFTQPALGQASSTQTATITNTSSTPAGGLAVSVTSPFSLVQNACTATLAAGGSCSTGVVFTPTANGAVTGALTVSSSGFATAATASLTGIGGSAGTVQVQPVSLSFQATGVGGTSAVQSVVLTNDGAVALSGLTLSTSGQFQLAATTCTLSLGIGASCTAQVAFSPSSAGQQTGSLTVSSSDLATHTQVSLSGMGFDFSVSAAGHSSLTIASGQTATFTINLATMSGSSGTFTFACSSLPSNSVCNFNPAAEVVTANATGSATVQIATGLASTSAQNRDLAPRASLSHTVRCPGHFHVSACIRPQTLQAALHSDCFLKCLRRYKLRRCRWWRRWLATSKFRQQEHSARNILRYRHRDGQRSFSQSHTYLDGGLAACADKQKSMATP